MQVKTQTVGRNEVPALFSYATSPEAEFVNPFGDRVLADVASAGVSDGLARALELHSLYRSVTRGASPRVGIAEARRSQELGILIAEAARSGGPVSAVLTAETEWERDYHAALAARWGVDPFDDVDLVLGRAATSTSS
jgi:hypothetical protein